MKTMQASRRRILAVLWSVLVLAAGGVACADVAGRIVRKGGQTIDGTIRWQAASKQYVVTTRDNIVIKLSPNEVEDIKVQKPQNIDKAANMVRNKQYGPAIPELEKIMQDYAMMQWDAMAGKYLVMAYLDTKEPAKAAAVGDSIVGNNPAAAWDKELAPGYWEALVLTEQFSKLRKMLDKAASRGDRDLAAVAQVRRGDLNRANGKLDEALVDGYLRTAYFYQSIKSVQPEALYKAAKCFEELGKHPYAEKMRKRLLAEYPTSEYAEKVKAGS